MDTISKSLLSIIASARSIGCGFTARGLCVIVAAVAVLATQPSAAAADSSTPWLGLNYNSQTPAPASALDQFVAHGIVYDRDSVEPEAGDTVSSRSFSALGRSVAAGMISDIEIDPAASNPTGCTANPAPTSWCLPTSADSIQSYVSGFISTVQSVLRAYPNRQFLFEPMDEPWYWASPAGTPPNYLAAAEYAGMLAKLLPAVAEATSPSIPLNDVYVPAAGWLEDNTYWIPDLYKAEPCLAPGSGPCESGAPPTPIAGWAVHPYGLPGSSTQGIDSVPVLRRDMRSGEDNIVVSEIGFCATTVDGGGGCDKGDWYGTSAQTADWLTQTLQDAYSMHQAGWLKAMILWLRSGGGYSMQLPDGTLTAQGEALLNFVKDPSGGPRASISRTQRERRWDHRYHHRRRRHRHNHGRRGRR